MDAQVSKEPQLKAGAGHIHIVERIAEHSTSNIRSALSKAKN
jgi:hypothetical protein